MTDEHNVIFKKHLHAKHKESLLNQKANNQCSDKTKQSKDKKKNENIFKRK